MSNDNDDEIGRILRHDMRGLRGEFPDGRLNPDDEGAMALAVYAENGVVILRFATQVTWIGLGPQDAADLASLLIKVARKAGIETGQSVTVKIGP
jgi:hypothetical protein